MNPPNHYSSMTDEQLAQWHQLSTRVERLAEELLAANEQILTLTAERDIQAAKLRGELSDQACALAALSEKHTNQQQAARRNAAALMVTLEALRLVCRCFAASNMSDARRYSPGEMFRAIAEAEEVLRINGFPF